MRHFLIGAVIGSALFQMWLAMREQDMRRMLPLFLILLLAIILLIPTGCAAPPLDVRPPIARMP